MKIVGLSYLKERIYMLHILQFINLIKNITMRKMQIKKKIETRQNIILMLYDVLK